jgi:hypothetical protein
MGTAAVGIAQKEDDEEGIDEQDIFDSVVFLLPAITFLLFTRVLGADDASFRPIMGNSCYVELALVGEPNVAGKMRQSFQEP